MEVRIATIADANDLFVLNALFDNITTIDLIKKSLLENDRELVSIAYVDGIPVGYCCGSILISMCYSSNRADIESLYVKDEYRKHGIGKALLSCLEQSFASQGVYHFHIITHTDNIKAQSLYEKLGYSKTNEILLDKSITPLNK